MKDFNFKIPQNIQFGMGSLKKLPEILTESRSDKILLVSDRGLEKIGVVKKVQDIIETAGLQCTSYLDVVPNPTMAVVNEAADLYRKCGATSIACGAQFEETALPPLKRALYRVLSVALRPVRHLL